MGLQPFLAADAGLPKDAREQVNGDVVMMGIGDWGWFARDHP
jgi:hypothetical protein